MIEIVVLSSIIILSTGLIYYTVYISSPKKNRNWEVKVREMSKLFNSASNHIGIATDLSPEFFADPRITESLGQAAQRGVQVRIVYDPAGYQLKELDDLQKLVKARLIEARKAKKAFTKETARHVMEIDGEWARLETYHPAKQMVEAGADARIYRSPAVAYFAESEFNRLWQNSVGQRGNSTRD